MNGRITTIKREENIEHGTRNIELRSNGRFKFSIHFVIRCSLFRVRYSSVSTYNKCRSLTGIYFFDAME